MDVGRSVGTWGARVELQRLPVWARACIFVTIYVALGYVSFLEPAVAGADVLWLPSGLLIGSLLLAPRRQWAPIIASAALGWLIFVLANGEPIGEHVLSMTVACIESLLGVWLFQRFVSVECDFEHTSHVLGFWLICGFIAPGIGSVIEASFVSGQVGRAFLDVLPGIFTAEAVGIVLIAPLVIAVGNRVTGRVKPLHGDLPLGRRLLIALIATVWAATSVIADVKYGQPTKYMTALALVMSASALGPAWTSVAGIVMAFLAFGGLRYSSHSFGYGVLESQVLAAQVFIGISLLVAHMMSASTRSLMRSRSETRAKEAALTHRHELMQYIIEHDRSAVAVHDRELRYIYVSQRYLDTYGVSESDVIGKHHYDVFPDLPKRWRDVHQRVLAGEVLCADDDAYERADGSVDWTRWECRPWYEADGTIGGIIVYTEIINERKRAQDKLIAYQGRLQRLASELAASGEREQHRLAVTLHDSVGQVLAAAKMQAQLLQGEEDAERRAEHLERLEDLISLSIEEVRHLTADLAPGVLVERGLEACLEWLADRFNVLYDLTCHIRVTGGEVPDHPDTTLVLFRIARECLNNVVRHSGVKEVLVTVRKTSGYTDLTVLDQGCGFDAETVHPDVTAGFGLFSMREECIAREGQFSVRSGTGMGTRVSVRIPALVTEQEPEAAVG